MIRDVDDPGCKCAMHESAGGAECTCMCPHTGVPLDTSCNCDLDSPCTYPPCVAERDREMREMFAEYKAGRLDPPADVWKAELDDQLRDAGRGHLVRDEPF